jgi:hypothetical protein
LSAAVADAHGGLCRVLTLLWAPPPRCAHACLLGLATVLALGPAAPALAAEIDSITDRTTPLDDAAGRLDEHLAGWLQTGVEAANNSRLPACDEGALYRGIQRAIARPFVGHSIAETLNADPALPSRRVMMDESVYRDLEILDAVSVHLKDLSAVIALDGALIGVDKIGHFLVEGWGYYEIAVLDGKGIEAAMEWGEHTERTWFGLYTTGVSSHADLVADFEGMRFWMNLIGRAPDPLAERRFGRRPYVKCSRGWTLFGKKKWRVAHDVEIERYVDPVWDEAVNCSSYRNAEIEAKVVARIEEQGAAAGVDYTCPIDAGACAAARERYGAYAERLLHPACLAAEASPRPWWKSWLD